MLALKALFSLLPFLGVASAAPVLPSGGVGVRPTDPPPQYIARTDFDFQVYNLAKLHEDIEYDLFNYAVARFSPEEFASQGIDAEQISLIQYMAVQEIGHATVLDNIMQKRGPKPCQYQYPFDDVQGFLAFAQALTRWSESGVAGILQHTDSRDSSTLVEQAIHIEGRQQMVLRQMAGAQPMPFSFVPGITPSMTWTLLAPWLKSCPAENPYVKWQNFPRLNITNDPSIIQEGYKAAIAHNRTALSAPGNVIKFEFEAPNKTVGPDGKYQTSLGANVTDGVPKFAAFISQLNVTYAPLTDVTDKTACAVQPGGELFNSTSVINGTNFILLTDTDLFVTPYNLSLLDAHIVAGPAIYQSG